METSRKTTIDDVALKAGVSTFTVSQALRGRAGVAAATRERVQTVAKQMGYQVNSAASLMAQRKTQKNQRRLLIGHLFENHFESPFRAGCDAHGWEGKDFCVSDFSSPAVASRILWQQGVDGLIIAGGGAFVHPFWKSVMEFRWDRFSVVKIARALPELRFNLVRHSAFDYMMMTLRKTVASGCRRMAIVLLESRSESDDLERLGALLAFKEKMLPPAVHCEWRISGSTPITNRLLDAATLLWLKEYSPDAIVVYHWSMLYQLIEEGFGIPETTSITAVLNTTEHYEGLPVISGCDLSISSLYNRALEILEGQIGRGERGFVNHPAEYIIEPEWVEGETLRTR
ncbi:MAG: LacI family DNA-binding transcriptional regulator [Verrucomicrobiota bacterium]|nr:LacI family DNA-binding transcriptional regulator [Verrucomicrobiota bacterium]